MELNFTSSNLTNSNTSLLSRFNSLVTAQVASLQPPELEKELAIMFLDIRNFTGLMESRPAREVVQVVKRLFSMFGQIVKSFGGTVVETAGDSLYAVFGMGGAIKEAVNESYQAAKMIFDTIDLFNAAHGNENRGELLEIGIGLHKGRL
ncbi:adenylate/guanylate cyclase domain-containing protein [Arcticibacter sp. MXS-1]|uniref:adenylate/guanylate cyclase domain-containing protein n=1 Tax=Arcticibacter sp. MXS-1 TaxID=3341726 RepID=UPI0035A8ED5A